MDFVRPPTIAKTLGVSQETVRNWIRSGELVGANIGNPLSKRKRWVASREAVDAFLESRRPPALTARPRRIRQLDDDVPDIVSTLF